MRIPLYRADIIVAHALVSSQDAYLAQWRWRLNSWGYAERQSPSGRPEQMSRLIMGLPLGDKRQADHWNRDRLDNRRANLRIVTQAENQQNRETYRGAASRFRGVSPTPTGGGRARARLNGVLHELGWYSTEEEAAEVAAAFRREHMPFSHEAGM